MSLKRNINPATMVKQLQQTFTPSKKDLEDAAQFAVGKIVGTARTGKSLKTGEAFPALSEKYVKRRKQNPTDAVSFRPAKSNITYTGQLLQAVSYTTNVALKQITLFIKDTTRDGITNKKLADILAKKGRDFFGLDKKTEDGIRSLFIKAARRAISLKRI